MIYIQKAAYNVFHENIQASSSLYDDEYTS